MSDHNKKSVIALVHFDDDSVYLTHYGRKGMEWGKHKFEEITTAATSAKNRVAEDLRKRVGTVKEAYEAREGIKTAAKSAASAAKGIAKDAASRIGKATNPWAAPAKATLAEKAADLKKNLAPRLKSAKEDIVNAWDTGTSVAKDKARQSVQNVRDSLKNARDVVKDKGFTQAAKDAAKEVSRNVKDTATSLVDKISDEAPNALETMKTGAKVVKQKIAEFIKKMKVKVKAGAAKVKAMFSKGG